MTWVSRSGTQNPDPIQLAGCEEPRQRAGTEAVGLRPRLTDPGVVGRDDQDLGDVGLDQALELPGVADHLERHPIVLPQALSEELDLIRPGLDPARRADPSFLCDRHLAELEVDVQTDCSHLLLLSVAWREKLWANDIDAYAL